MIKERGIVLALLLDKSVFRITFNLLGANEIILECYKVFDGYNSVNFADYVTVEQLFWSR